MKGRDKWEAGEGKGMKEKLAPLTKYWHTTAQNRDNCCL